MIQTVLVNDLRMDGKTQKRPLDETVVKKYNNFMEEGTVFPPIEVVYDGKDYWIWDGFHRLFAMLQLEIMETEVNVTKGTLHDAVWLSLSANKDHGMSRQVGIAKDLIIEALTDPDWSQLPFAKIAKHIGVTRQYMYQIAKAQGVEEAKQHSTETKVEAPKEDIPEPGSEKKVSPVKRTNGLYDMVGQKVPANIEHVFVRIDEFREMIRYCNKMLSSIKKGKEDGDIIYRNLKLDAILGQISDVKRTIKYSMPYAVCPYCFSDANNEKCSPCSGSGWVTELVWIAIPDDIKGGR